MASYPRYKCEACGHETRLDINIKYIYECDACKKEFDPIGLGVVTLRTKDRKEYSMLICSECIEKLQNVIPIPCE